MVVAVDYFTKYVEVEALATITVEKIVRFIYQTIFCRFGMPAKIVSDNGTQFDNAKFRQFYNDHKVQKGFSVVARPQTNGQVEAVNKT